MDHCLLRLIPSRQGATDEALICLSRLVGQVRAARVHPSLFLPVRFTVLSVQHSHVCGPLFLVTGAVFGGRSIRRNLENWSGNFSPSSTLCSARMTSLASSRAFRTAPQSVKTRSPRELFDIAVVIFVVGKVVAFVQNGSIGRSEGQVLCRTPQSSNLASTLGIPH